MLKTSRPQSTSGLPPQLEERPEGGPSGARSQPLAGLLVASAKAEASASARLTEPPSAA